LTILRSLVGEIGVLAVDELLPPFGSVAPGGGATVAVLVRVPDALLDKVAVKLKVAFPPTSRFTVVLIFPVPLAVPQLDPLVAVQFHEAFDKTAGSVSVTVAPLTALGPLFVTSI
jgi:hypothetical protein